MSESRLCGVAVQIGDCPVCYRPSVPLREYVVAATGLRALACLDEHACAEAWHRAGRPRPRRPRNAKRPGP